MALDRQTIEKRDFPIGRRGYEPEAVDEHLARVADELEAIRRQTARRSPTESIAAVASQQVAAIVQAAEATASDLERQAQEEADRIRREAKDEARAVREEATAASEAHVGRVSQSVANMLQRVDAMESELGALVETLRTGANRLQADLTLLQGNMSELAAAPAPGRVGAVAHGAPRPSVPAPPAPAEAPPAPRAEAAPEEPPVEAEVVEETEVADAPAPVPAAGAEAAGDADEDVEGARLIALNMALNGTARDETERYLAENFDLSDPQGLLDEVYASVEA